MVVILMGVSGVGKTTLGKALAKALSWDFFDGDDFHPEENVRKMAAQSPLTDSDRIPWLLALRTLISRHLEEGTDIVLACSALKRNYREVLQRDDKRVQYVYLKAPQEVIAQRLAARKGHFMPEGLLQSQFDELEEPHADEAWTISAEQSPRQTLEEIQEALPHIEGIKR